MSAKTKGAAKLLPAFQLNELVRQIKAQQLPACEGKISAEPSLRGRDKHLGNKCGNVAKVEIDGKKYCLRHAGAIALYILLKAKP